MKTKITKLPQSEIELRFEVAPEEFQKFYDEALLKLGENIEIDGFRKGKVPREVVERKVGLQKTLEEAAGSCLRENYVKAIQENNIEAIGQPQVDILKLAKGNPFEFKARVAVLPEVKMPDYKKIVSQIKRQKVEVTEKEINRLREEKERMAREKLREEILTRISQSFQIEIPQVLVEAEKKHMLEDFKRQVVQMMQISFEEYLKKVSKTEKEILDSLTSEAEKRVKNSLVLKKIEKLENIGFTDQELKRESEKILSRYSDTAQVDRERLEEYTKEVIKNEKTFQLLESLTQ